MNNTNGRAQINNLHIDHQVWGGGVGGEAAGLHLFKELRKRSGRVGFRWEVHVRVWTHLVLSSNHGQVTTVPIEHGVLLSFSSLNRIINASRIRYFFYPARALRALGLLLADGNPTVGGGKTFWRPNFFTETAVTPERKVEKWFPRWEINRHVEG